MPKLNKLKICLSTCKVKATYFLKGIVYVKQDNCACCVYLDDIKGFKLLREKVFNVSIYM